MKILLTNDDGVDAPGLAALRATVFDSLDRLGVSATIVTVAPDRGRSECGHSVTNGRPLSLRSLGEDGRGHPIHSLDGTPVDCVRVAMTTLIPDVDVVLSGVNAGANLGVDLMVSGTFAAAREASSHGVPSLAISQYRHPDVARTWDHVPIWTSETVAEFLQRCCLSGPSRATHSAPLWNLNLPAIDPRGPAPTRIECNVDVRPLQRTAILDAAGAVTFELDFHARPRDPGSDVDHCFNGHMTLSRIQ